jgi:leucyl-tRNA synthetase
MDTVPINFCPKCKTGLANEEVKDGTCERCHTEVTRKDIRQWILKITAYAERLLKGLDELDWPESIKLMQRNWIGRSEGADVDFPLANPVPDAERNIRVFTTRPDTLFGATYMVLAPEHPLVLKITTPEKSAGVMTYVDESKNKSELQRTDLAKEKTGVFTGAYAVNPVNDEKIPIWIADYVLISYGTGAIMAVPAHDQRDYEFAVKYSLPIIQVVSPPDNIEMPADRAFEGDGFSVNSGQFSGLPTSEFKKAITEWLEQRKIGKGIVRYKLRDWIFSRQRYWGEPIPVVHCPECGIVPLHEKDLPLLLPEVEKYEPTGTGESPLSTIESFVNTECPKCNAKARRETNTMPQWAGSCWYYLRYIDPHNDNALASKEKEKRWMNVDLYVGGAEHAVLHLLYARFWHMFLYDIRAVSTGEPFQTLRNQGIILGEDGQKMSKSRGNVINPDNVVLEFGADSMRLYEMFMGPIEVMKPWSMQGITGIRRFLERVYRIFQNPATDEEISPETRKLLHKTIKKVTDDIEMMRFNTAISAMMILANEIGKKKVQSREILEKFCLILSPFAPHLCEELWEILGHSPSVAKVSWPEYDPSQVADEEVTVAIQVNGKLRGQIVVLKDLPEDEIREKAVSEQSVLKWIQGREIRKVIIVPNRLINIVV